MTRVPSTPSSSIVTGNPTCGDFGFDVEFKIDEQPVEGETYSDTDLGIEVTITDVTDGDPMTFSFTSNIAVSAVFVKAGNGGILYTFDPPTTVGTDLASPKDSISHVSFCWNEDTTTTTEQETTTSTTAKDTTTSTTVKDTTTSTTAAQDDHHDGGRHDHRRSGVDHGGGCGDHPDDTAQRWPPPDGYQHRSADRPGGAAGGRRYGARGGHPPEP